MKRREFVAMSSTGLALTAGIASPSAAAPPSLAPAPRGRTISAAEFGALGDGRTDDSIALQKALAAMADDPLAGMLVIPPGDYRITRPLRITLRKRRSAGMWGISAYGARLRSRIADGGDVLTVDSDTVARFMLIEGLSIRGSGREGTGLSLHCDGQGRYLYNASLRDLVIEGCGKDGCRMIGNIFESQISNTYFRDNGENGMTAGHGKRGGVLSAVHVYGSVFGGNARHGVALVNKANDVSFNGCYFLLNGKFGLVASNGCVLLAHSGFENNHKAATNFATGGAGLRLNAFGTLVGCTAYSIYNQTHLVSGYLTSRMVMIGCTGKGDRRARKAGLADLRGNGDADVTVIGSSGRIDDNGGIAMTEVGQPGFGARFGSQWDSGNLVRLGEYRLWVDGSGVLRMKSGDPSSDTDGSPAGGR